MVNSSQISANEEKIQNKFKLVFDDLLLYVLISIDKCISASYCYLISLSVLSVGPSITTIVFVADSALVIQLSYLCEVKLSECYLE